MQLILLASTWFKLWSNTYYKICMGTLFSDTAVTVNSTNIANTEDDQISGKVFNIKQNQRFF